MEIGAERRLFIERASMSWVTRWSTRSFTKTLGGRRNEIILDYKPSVGYSSQLLAVWYFAFEMVNGVKGLFQSQRDC